MPRRNEPTSRTCIVTRQVRPKEELLRFVLAPDGSVVLDLKNKLPGRGVWVTAARAHVETAEKKKLFARALKEPVNVEAGLADTVAARLKESALGALSLARKAGALTLGFMKVDEAIAAGKVAALIEASDAGADGTEKLSRAVARQGIATPVFREFTTEDLGLALGRAHVIHAALLADRASGFALDQLHALARYFQIPHQGDFHVPLDETAEPTVEHPSI
jgi:predicted RNA-binding protein YlxR (DUF448 family)